MKIHYIDQNSPEWYKLRLGKITASIMSKITTKAGNLSSSADEVVNRAVAEIILQEPDQFFVGEAMLRGQELEDEALRFFNFTNDYNFKKCGFVDSGLGFGCSPDGVDEAEEIGLELKCPLAHTHLAYLASGELPDQYIQQVQMSLLVTGWDKWIFGSYHPSFPCFTVVVERDEAMISAMRSHLESVCEQVRSKLDALTKKLSGLQDSPTEARSPKHKKKTREDLLLSARELSLVHGWSGQDLEHLVTTKFKKPFSDLTDRELVKFQKLLKEKKSA